MVNFKEHSTLTNFNEVQSTADEEKVSNKLFKDKVDIKEHNRFEYVASKDNFKILVAGHLFTHISQEVKSSHFHDNVGPEIIENPRS